MVEFLDDFVSLFFPKYCHGCRDALVKGEFLICTKCIRELPRTDFHLNVRNTLYERLNGRLAIRHALAFLRFEKDTAVQNLLHALKYGHHPEIGHLLGRVYGEELVDNKFQFDAVVPVPLYDSKFRLRGYNQSTAFARGLSDALAIRCEANCLKRTRYTETQTHKSRFARWKNVENAFSLTDAAPVQDTRVLLVDDVVTTGATIESCGFLLNKAGCSSLSVACIAVA